MSKTILLTGGTGSFGTAFIRTLLREEPETRIISVSRNAEQRYRLEREFSAPRLMVLPGDVRQPRDLVVAFELDIDAVVHAAAEKHVGTGEKYRHYVESTNIDGTIVILALARNYGVRRVLVLSTDKACSPLNLYGRSKARAEEITISKNVDGLAASCVRYGNVAASSGSVLPLFFQQRINGTLTVTDRRMSRFWMPIADDARVQLVQEPGGQPVMSAVRWVRLALEHMRGGEIFIPQIPSATVLEMAHAMAPEAEIVETGIRPGEKLAEDLISYDEGFRTWRVPFGGWAILPKQWPHDIPAGWVQERAGFTYRSDQGMQPVRVEQSA